MVTNHGHEQHLWGATRGHACHRHSSGHLMGGCELPPSLPPRVRVLGSSEATCALQLSNMACMLSPTQSGLQERFEATLTFACQIRSRCQPLPQLKTYRLTVRRVERPLTMPQAVWVVAVP